MKRNYIRLQGAEWHNKKDNMILISYKKNKYGRIKGFYKEKDKDGYWYTHWMNDKEIEEFKKEHGIKVTNYSISISSDENSYKSNWEDLKKWLEKKKKNDKYHYDYLERLATYDLVLDKMIGLEGRDKND